MKQEHHHDDSDSAAAPKSEDVDYLALCFGRFANQTLIITPGAIWLWSQL